MSLAQTASHNDTVQGIGWMVLTGLLFVCVTGIVRHLGSDMPAVEAAFIRYLIGIVLLLSVAVLVIPYLWYTLRQEADS